MDMHYASVVVREPEKKQVPKEKIQQSKKSPLEETLDKKMKDLVMN